MARCVNKYKRENLPNRKCRNLNQRLFQKSSYYKQNFLIQTFVFENCMDDADMKFCQSCLTKMIIADNKGILDGFDDGSNEGNEEGFTEGIKVGLNVGDVEGSRDGE